MTELRCTELAARICQLVLDLNRLFEEAAKEGLVVQVEVEHGLTSKGFEERRDVAALRVSVAQPTASMSFTSCISEDPAR